MSDSDQYEGPLVSAWGMWLSSLSAEETENWLNPFYYVFGTVDANYDCLSSNSMEPLHFQALLSEFVPDLKAERQLWLVSRSVHTLITCEHHVGIESEYNSL